MYCGMIASWVGTVIVSTTIRNSTSRPRKCSFAKAKPPSAHSTACPTPIVVATTRLFPIACRNGTVSKTSPARWKKLSPGTISGGICVAVAESVEATTNIQ